MITYSFFTIKAGAVWLLNKGKHLMITTGFHFIISSGSHFGESNITILNFLWAPRISTISTSGFTKYVCDENLYSMKTYSVISLWLCSMFFLNQVSAQTPVNTFTTVSNVVVPGGTLTQSVRSHGNSVNGVLPNKDYTVKYNNTGNVAVTDFTITGKTYVKFSGFDTIILRRVANTWIPSNGNKQHIYCQGPATIDNTTFTMPFPVAYPVVANHAYMERVMKEGYINRGSDNVFTNDSTSDLTHNNIERADFVYKAGMATTSPSSAGFLISERGGNDAFKIAAIKSIDANGNPTSFGPVLSVTTASYGAAMLTTATYVMRKDVSDNSLRPFSLVGSQSIRSIFIRFSDLGIASMQNIYGYALMANDVTASTSAQVLAYTNSTYFPQNTNSGNGGMDISSAPGIFHTDLILASHFLNFSAQLKNCEQFLQWQDDEYMQVRNYSIEKSTDMESFSTIATVDGMRSASNSFTDKNFTGPCYYRIKVQENSGEYFYSSVVFANKTCSVAKASLYPNPAKDMLTISCSNGMRVSKVTIIAINGKEFAQYAVSSSSSIIKLNMTEIPAGQYFIKLSDTNGLSYSYPVIKF